MGGTIAIQMTGDGDREIRLGSLFQHGCCHRSGYLRANGRVFAYLIRIDVQPLFLGGLLIANRRSAQESRDPRNPGQDPRGQSGSTAFRKYDFFLLIFEMSRQFLCNTSCGTVNLFIDHLTIHVIQFPAVQFRSLWSPGSLVLRYSHHRTTMSAPDNILKTLSIQQSKSCSRSLGFDAFRLTPTLVGDRVMFVTTRIGQYPP